MTGLLLIGVAALWFWFAIWFGQKIGSLLPDRPWRMLVQLALIALLIPLPLIDEIVGGWQFRKLCRKHDAIRLDRENIKNSVIYSAAQPASYVDGTWVPVRKQTWSYKFKKTGLMAMQYDSFHAKGGWLISTLRISEGNAPLLFRDSCFPNENPRDLLKGFNVTVQDSPNTN
jgi:hypothetical protein